MPRPRPGDRLEASTRWWLTHLLRGRWQVVAWVVLLGLLLIGWGVGLSW